MHRVPRFGWIALLPLLSGLSGCASDTACACTIENNGERRTLVCGQSACIGGLLATCTAKNRGALRGACNAPAASSEPDAGRPGQDPSSTPDRSCDDLLTFCNTRCSAPDSVSADCQVTASSGNAAACVAWSLTNGVLCHP